MSEQFLALVVACLVTMGIAFLISIVLAPILIPVLHRLKFGQQIREIGPSWHKKKSGTPTMGGIIFIVASVCAALIAGLDREALSVLLVATGFGIIGFIDDFIKVVLKRNLGLTALQKLILQIILAVVFVFVCMHLGFLQSDIIIPFMQDTIDLQWAFIPFAVFILVGFVNAVNLTDGLDGLATSVTMVVSLFLVCCAVLFGKQQLALFCIAVFGGCAGFLIFNHYPAKVFMGDTGSLFLGGAVAAAAVLMKMPLILVVSGIIYVIEALSVMLQVMSFKLTGKRIFKMSPIHHHFEMCGWREVKVVWVFCAVSALACILGVYCVLPASVIYGA